MCFGYLNRFIFFLLLFIISLSTAVARVDVYNCVSVHISENVS